MISTALAVLFTKNARIIKKSCRKIWWNKIFVVPLHSQFRNDCFHRANGVLTERLGNGLQNRVERFDSARHLHQKEKFIDLNFSFFYIFACRPSIIVQARNAGRAGLLPALPAFLRTG